MPDPYWENIGKEIKARRERGEKFLSAGRHNDPDKFILELTCKRCGEKFRAPGNRVMCDDCKPNPKAGEDDFV